MTCAACFVHLSAPQGCGDAVLDVVLVNETDYSHELAGMGLGVGIAQVSHCFLPTGFLVLIFVMM